MQNPLSQYIKDGLGKSALTVEQAAEFYVGLSKKIETIKETSSHSVEQVWYTQSQIAKRFGWKGPSSACRLCIKAVESGKVRNIPVGETNIQRKYHIQDMENWLIESNK